MKFQEGIEIKCSRSWDGTYWFFFCDQCKKTKCRPHIRGVLRGARIWQCPVMKRPDWTSDSEYSYYSSEGISEEEYLAPNLSWTLPVDQEHMDLTQ